VLLLLLGLAGPVVGLGDPRAIGTGPRLSPPAPEWIFGTDALGRSLLPRVLEGIRTTFVIATIAAFATIVAGTLIGLIAAYLGGFADQIVVRAADVLFAFPALLLGMLVSAVVGFGTPGALLSIALITLPLVVRVARAAGLTVARREFIASAEVSGASGMRVLAMHLLPNVTGPMIVQASYVISIGMLIESSLSYLGLGVQAPEASLGSLVRAGSTYLTVAPWMVLIPGLFLAVAIMSVNLLGDGLRDALDPRDVRALR
jgi:peptide/nickel transport system permease protein